MQQFNFFERQCPLHPENKNRLLCINCTQSHVNHNENLLDQAKFEIKMRESLNNLQSFIDQMNIMINGIISELKKIIATLEAQYNKTIEQLSQMQNKQLNQHLSCMVQFEDKKTFINLLLERRIKLINEVVNKFQNKSLEEIKQNVINLQNMEKVENYYQQGKEYFYKNDQKSAINMFDEALKINSNHIQSLSSKGESLAKIDSFKECIECFDKAISIMDVQYKQLQYHKGNSLRIQKKYKESIGWFDKALTIDPNYKVALYAKGDSLLMLNQYKDSIVWFKKSLAIDPKYKEALHGKGDALRMEKKYAKAIKYFDSVLQIDSKYGVSLGSKSCCLLQLGKFDEAEKCLNQAIQLNPEHEFNQNLLKILEQKKNECINQQKKFNS